MTSLPNSNDDPASFKSAVPTGRLLGIDLGTKTIGLALSDRSQTIATASHTLSRRKFKQDAEALVAFMSEQEVKGIVVGLPVNMDGSEGPRAQSTRAFVRNLNAVIALPVLLWDERLSTVAAERALIEADLSRKKRAGTIDAVAAALILQSALDRLRSIDGA